MAYDSARGVTVLFGGYGIGGYQSDTWEWNGSTWTLRASTGPSKRQEAAMVYDEARGVTVLFGGLRSDFTTLDDTWEWDGSGTWTFRTDTGPSARQQSGAAFDRARRVMVLFGGGTSDLKPFGDTWEWDGSTWTQRASTGPHKRMSHGMAYDSKRSATVVFGGFDHGWLGDTWSWDGNGDAAWSNYGSGWPGALGVPSFTASADAVLCTTISMSLANSRGSDTTALLWIGAAETDFPTSFGGHVLVLPLARSALISLPAGGLAIPIGLPCEGTLCGRSIFFQAFELDPAASDGISFTRGLRLVLGS
jgi:hypothetical protein